MGHFHAQLEWRGFGTTSSKVISSADTGQLSLPAMRALREHDVLNLCTARELPAPSSQVIHCSFISCTLQSAPGLSWRLTTLSSRIYSLSLTTPLETQVCGHFKKHITGNINKIHLYQLLLFLHKHIIVVLGCYFMYLAQEQLLKTAEVGKNETITFLIQFSRQQGSILRII